MRRVQRSEKYKRTETEAMEEETENGRGQKKGKKKKRRNKEEGLRDQKIKMGGNKHFLHNNIHINRIAQMEDP